MQSLAHPACRRWGDTRELRALELYRTRGRDIQQIAPDVYRVPSQDGSRSYDVLYGELEECPCTDHQRRGVNCVHILAVGAKTADDARLRGATAIESRLVAPAAEYVVGCAAAADFVIARLPCQLIFGAQAFNKISTVPALDCVAISGTEESVVPGSAHAQVARPIGALYVGR